MEQQAVDLSAKLLANEDIQVVRGRVSTASFDIKSRVLTLPMWQEMTPEVEDMLVGHEVGHALYTTDEYSDTIKENLSIKSYLNVIEDVRIEKLIKRKYPGLRRRMAAGYKQLNDRDFFETDGKDLNKMLLIDRINLYFKTNAILDFTPEERDFVQRAERTESIQDVIDLANDIFVYAQGEHQKRMEEIEQEQQEYALFDDEDEDDEENDFMDLQSPDDVDYENSDDEDDGEGMEVPDSGDSDDDEETEEDTGMAGSEPELNGNASDPLESKTMKSFDSKLEDLADTETEYNYFNIYTTDPKNTVVGYKKILEITKTKLPEYKKDHEDTNLQVREEFLKFKAETSKEVNYLVKEFEMRKSATEYKRTQQSKTGSIDMKKIYGYQIKDDIFKRVNVVYEGKKHGMIILVDWSGSMHNVMRDTLKQVVSLAMFCARIKIPYRVYGFTNGYYDEDMREVYNKQREDVSRAYNNNEKTIFSYRFNLLELFNDKMSSSEFFTMAENILDFRFFWIRKFALSSTPLNEALLYLHENMGTFINQNNVEKMTFITLTDGEGHPLDASASLRSRKLLKDSYWDREKDVRVPATWSKVKNFYRDEVTKKTYQFTDENNDQTRTILNMIRDRYNCRSVGFIITGTSMRDLHWILRNNTKLEGYDVNSHIPALRRDMRSDGFASFKGAGRDELFVLSQRKMRIDDKQLDVSGDMTARKLASNFSKFLNNKKTSRVLLSRFVDYVA